MRLTNTAFVGLTPSVTIIQNSSSLIEIWKNQLMEKHLMVVGLILILATGCSGSSSTSAQAESGIGIAQLAGVWNFIPVPPKAYDTATLNSLDNITFNTITLNSDQTAMVNWLYQTSAGSPVFTACFSGTWTVNPQGAGTITVQNKCGDMDTATVVINFQVSRDFNQFLFNSSISVSGVQGTGTLGMAGTAIRHP